MKYAIVVNEGPFNHQASDSAYHFVKHALAKGHEVQRVFFYYDGVHNGNKHSAPQSDDRNIVKRWSQLAETNQIDLTICVAAGLRRGIVDDILAPANRTIVFGD
jgi:tRNA 2-thiouridine synthesizing protein D